MTFIIICNQSQNESSEASQSQIEEYEIECADCALLGHFLTDWSKLDSSDYSE